MKIDPIPTIGAEAFRAASPRPGPASGERPEFPAPKDPEAVKAAAAAANEAMQASGSGVEFRVDGDTGMTVVRVVEQQSGRIIRQIPSEEMLRIAQALDRMQGMLVRNSA